MPKSKAIAAPPKPPFLMPRVHESQTVKWYPDRYTEQSQPAVVTKVGEQAINISIFLDGEYALLCKSGVRHKSDPDVEIIDRAGMGVWDFAIDAEALNAAAIAEMGRLEARICLVEKVVTDAVEKLMKALNKSKD